MAAARCCTQAAAGGRSELTPSASAADHIPPACGALAPAAGQQRSSLSRMDADEPGPAPGPHVPGPASKEAPALGAPLHFSPRSHSGGALEAGDHPALRGALAGLGAPHLGPPHARSGAAAAPGRRWARSSGACPELGARRHAAAATAHQPTRDTAGSPPGPSRRRSSAASTLRGETRQTAERRRRRPRACRLAPSRGDQRSPGANAQHACSMSSVSTFSTAHASSPVCRSWSARRLRVCIMNARGGVAGD